MKRINRASLWRFDPTIFEEAIRRARVRPEYEARPWEAVERAAVGIAEIYVRPTDEPAMPADKPEPTPDAISTMVGLEKKLLEYLKRFRADYVVALKSVGYDDIDAAAKVDRLLDQAKVVVNKNRQVKVWKRLKQQALSDAKRAGGPPWQDPPPDEFCPSSGADAIGSGFERPEKPSCTRFQFGVCVYRYYSE